MVNDAEMVIMLRSNYTSDICQQQCTLNCLSRYDTVSISTVVHRINETFLSIISKNVNVEPGFILGNHQYKNLQQVLEHCKH